MGMFESMFETFTPAAMLRRADDLNRGTLPPGPGRGGDEKRRLWAEYRITLQPQGFQFYEMWRGQDICENIAHQLDVHRHPPPPRAVGGAVAVAAEGVSVPVALKSPQPATEADLLALPEEGRGHELLSDGVIVEKQAGFRHSFAQNRLVQRVSPYDRAAGGGDQPGGWRFLVEQLVRFESGQTLRPDLAGWHRERLPRPPPDQDTLSSTCALGLGRGDRLGDPRRQRL